MRFWQFFQRRIWASGVTETFQSAEPQDAASFSAACLVRAPTGNTELDPVTGREIPKQSEQ